MPTNESVDCHEVLAILTVLSGRSRPADHASIPERQTGQFFGNAWGNMWGRNSSTTIILSNINAL